MSQLVEDSHMAAATALCAMPNSPMPKKLLRGAGNGVHPSPLGSSPFSLFTASLSPMYFGSQSRDGAGSLAASPLPRQTPTLTARLTPGMYTLDPDSNSISGLMSSPLVNNASNASFASYTSRGRNPSFLQRLKFDEESSIPFMPDTPQHSNASTTPGGRSRIRICNGEISKFKIAVINYDDEAARDATITNSAATANSNDPLSFLGQQAVKSENGELNDAINTMAHDFMMEQGSTSGKFKSTTMGKLTGKRAGSGPSHLANSTLSDTVLPAAQRLRDTCDGDDASSLSARSKGKYKRKREGDVTDHLHDLQSSAKKSNQGVPNPGDDPVTPANQRLMRAGRDITSVSLAPSTPSEQKRNKCNCKKSKCLKLYCECFAAGLYCDGCNCNNCANNKLHEEQRESAVKSTLDRNPNAFRPKIKATPLGKDEAAASGVHYKGCHCKKSYCLKKYCECFQAGVHCGDRCKCSNCKNFEGSTALAEVSSSSVKRSNKQNNMITPAKSTTMNARNISSLPRGSLSKANVKSFTNLTPSNQTSSGKLPRATGANSTPSLQMNRQHNTALNMTPQGHGGRYTQQQTPQSILRSGSTIKQNKLEGFPLATKPVVGISTTKQPQHPSVSPPRNNRRPNQGATTAHVITKNKEYEEDVQAFGTKNVKLDKRLVVSILTYLDNSDLYQTSLVSKTLGPIAISDSLWEFPTEAESALGDAVAQP